MTSAGTMAAWVIRPDRLGDPMQAMQLERIDVPEPGPGEVRVRVMAAGVNYNGVWAAAGLPVSIFRYTGYDFHIAGSDASGVVDKVGPGVTRWTGGDEVVIHCNQSCGECAECNGRDPMACSRQRIWAYESNWGSFAEFGLSDPDTGERNLDEIKRFGGAIRSVTGGVDCDVVFEHVGAATFFTSVFVCRTFGTIVICGATSGFQLDFDVRYLWMRQKSILGSHFANAYECQRANQLIAEGKIAPVLSRVFP